MNSFNPFGLGQLGGGMTRRDFEQGGGGRRQGQRLVQPDRAVPDRAFETPAGVRSAPRSRAANLPPSANDLSAYDGGPRAISPRLRAARGNGNADPYGSGRGNGNVNPYGGTRPQPRQPNLSDYDGGPRAISPALRAPARGGAAAAGGGAAAAGGAMAPAAQRGPAPAPAPAGRTSQATMRPIGQPAATPAPPRSQPGATPAAATAPAAPTEKAPAGVQPAVAATSAPAATTPAAASGGTYKPVADLGEARRRAFMDAPDTATGMKRVRELLGSEAGVDPMELNKFSVAELEKRALERRNATNWSTELSNTANAFTSGADVISKLGIEAKPMQFESNPFEGSTANATAFNTDKTFGFDFAVASGGSPLVREIVKDGADSPFTKEGLGNWFSNYTNALVDEQVRSGEINKPVEMLGKPLVIGNREQGVSPSSYIEAFQNAGEPAPIDGKTAAVAKAIGGDVIGGGRRRLSGNLGFRDLASLPPLVKGAYQAAGIR